MASKIPGVGYLARFKHSPQYQRTREMYEPFVRGQDWNTREQSIENIKKIADKRAEYFHRMNVGMRDGSKTADEAYRLRELGEIMEKMVEALQAWHFERFGSATPVAV